MKQTVAWRGSVERKTVVSASDLICCGESNRMGKKASESSPEEVLWMCP